VERSPLGVAREGWPIIGIEAALGALAWAWLSPWTGSVSLPLLLFSVWFFRDPDRVTPADPRALVSPADGQVIEAGPRRVSVFMNVLDVHVCRAPAAGRVIALDHRSGRFLPAFKPEAADQNERLLITLEDAGRQLQFSLVAGLIARRIVSRVRVGQQVERGQRVGLIRFGSRVDLDLPPGATAAVQRGARVVAGVTVLARLSGPGS
jgi:phosphatidylserine decarboxylase